MKAKFINEKFTEDSDPIEDMGIGAMQVRDFDTIRESAEFFINNIKVLTKGELFSLNDAEGKTLKYFYDFISGWGTEDIPYISIRDIDYDIEMHRLKFLAEFMKMVYKITHTVAASTEESGGNCPWLSEKFIEDSDPIEDMDIGMVPKKEARKFMEEFRGNLNTIAQKYLNDRMNHGGAYIVHAFFKAILDGIKPQEAFILSVENENMHHDSKYDIDLREKIAKSILKYHDIKINPQKGFYTPTSRIKE